MKKFKIILIVLFSCMFSVTFGQIDVKEKVKNETVYRAERKVDEKIDQTLDKLEKGIGGIFKKKAKPTKEDEASEGIVKEQDTPSDKEKSPSDKKDTSSDDEPIKDNKQKLESYTQYDFVPGDKVIYFDDFSQVAIGDFPANWSSNGSGEIATVNIAHGNWLQFTTKDGYYCYTKPIEFPQNFIMEFDIIPDDNFFRGYHLTLYEDKDNRELNDDLFPGTKGVHVKFDDSNWEIESYNNLENDFPSGGKSDKYPVIKEKVNHVIVWIQNRRLRIYHAGAKVVDMPTIIYADTKFNRFHFNGWSTESKPYISNLKITTAASDTRSKLITEGKLITYGIYFDVNSDKVKPESNGTLNDIAKVLKETPNMNIKIVGHTDSDGDDTKNFELSQRRAISVKNALSNNFGITADRFQTDGAGESMPLVPNTTAEQKSKNRRVEFIKI